MIDYTDEEPHTATVKEHIKQLIYDLREFCATNNAIIDYVGASTYIKETGAILEVLNDRNFNDIITLAWHDWAGFIASDEEK